MNKRKRRVIETRLFCLDAFGAIAGRDFVNRQHKGSRPQILDIITAVPTFRHLLIGDAHGVIQTLTHQFQFARAAQILLFKFRCHEPTIAQVLIQTIKLGHKQVVARLFFAAVHTTETNMA